MNGFLDVFAAARGYVTLALLGALIVAGVGFCYSHDATVAREALLHQQLQQSDSTVAQLRVDSGVLAKRADSLAAAVRVDSVTVMRDVVRVRTHTDTLVVVDTLTGDRRVVEVPDSADVHKLAKSCSLVVLDCSAALAAKDSSLANANARAQEWQRRAEFLEATRPGALACWRQDLVSAGIGAAIGRSTAPRR